uniref:Uncharacterized protein n=1 Tax=Tetranychus urticae TaxID=32264 RepID=A0A158P514_TETUR
MIWKHSKPLVNNQATLRICFSYDENDQIVCKRIDIRHFFENKPTKYGISICASQFEFIIRHVQKFLADNNTPDDAFFNITINKISDKRIKISGEKTLIITSSDFWQEVLPLVPALIFCLKTKELPIRQLMDLYLCSKAVPKECLLKKKWSDKKVKHPCEANCILLHLGLIRCGDLRWREIDYAELNKFSSSESFDSLALLQYI